MIRVFTAFSGYDSQCLALNRIGVDYELVGWSEIDKFAIQAHNALFPQWADRNYGDISKIDWAQVPDFDLFTYSSPCQDFSQAGKQAGAVKGSGTRSSLLWECERAIQIKRPKYLLFENVAAVASKKFVKLFNSWQLTLEEMGYSNFTQVLNAKTHGYPTPVPQNRERIFMVSILNCDQPFYFPEAQLLTTRLKDVLEQNVDEKYYLKDERLDGLRNSTIKEENRGNGFGFMPTDYEGIAHTISTNNGCRKADNFVKIAGNVHPGQNGTLYDTDGIAPTICAGEGVKTQTKIVEYEKTINAKKDKKGVQKDISSGRIQNCTSNSKEPFNNDELEASSVYIQDCGIQQVLLGWTRDEKGNVVDRHPVEVANAVTAAKRDNTQNYVVIPMIFDDYNGKIREDQDTCGTLTTNCGNDAPRNGFKVIEPQELSYRIRKLTPRECFRLMGVSDADIDKIQAAGISRSQQYKMAGNSIVVNCLAAIFRQLFIGNFNKVVQTQIF